MDCESEEPLALPRLSSRLSDSEFEEPLALPRRSSRLAKLKKRKREVIDPTEERDYEDDGVEAKGPVSIFWDVENCKIPEGVPPNEVACNIRKSLHMRGIKGKVTSFSAYGDFSRISKALREECERSGIDLMDVPDGRKDAADKAILVDMLFFALDNPPPSTLLLISGDVDFARALHKLEQRGHFILVAVDDLRTACAELWSAARFVWNWPEMASSQADAKTPYEILNPEAVQLHAEDGNDSGLPSATITELNPTSSNQPRDVKPMPLDVINPNGIDDVKKDILMLLHENRGTIKFTDVSGCYMKMFKKSLILLEYGYNLKRLLEEISDDVYVSKEHGVSYFGLKSKQN